MSADRESFPKMPKMICDLGIAGGAELNCGRAHLMPRDLKLAWAIAGGLFVGVMPITDNASAISLEVAKKCHALTAKAFPPRQIGNPAAGSTAGTGADERAYFNECVAKESKPPKSEK
jgi:hypothetical protein